MWNHDEMPLLPATGQTTSYRTGDDGTFRAGRPGGNRFRPLGDGTVFDRHTSLLWVRQPELVIPGAAGIHPTNQVQAARGEWANATAYASADLAKDAADGTYWVCSVAHNSAAAGTFAADRAANPTHWRQSVWAASAANLTTPAAMAWNAAIDACLALPYAGYDDWRLPNANEVNSLFLGGNASAPCIDKTAFPNTQAQNYWSGSTYLSATGWAMIGQFQGKMGMVYLADKTSACYVRPVRGGRTNG
jgi:hypothetical protein